MYVRGNCKVVLTPMVNYFTCSKVSITSAECNICMKVRAKYVAKPYQHPELENVTVLAL